MWKFCTTLPPGDVLTLTAAVRDLHLSHPDKFITDVGTNHPDIWLNNPYITPLPKEQGVNLQVHYPLIHESNQRGIHFINGYRQYIETKMGVAIPATDLKPDIHFSKEELANRPIKEKYWVMFAGGKSDFTTKWWDKDNYQEVVNKLKDTVKFVQVGSSKDQHPELSGVIDMIGKTSFRELMVLIKHSEGVVCPITCGLHIAAACDKPCVIIAGGREPPWWEKYEGQTYIHTMGQLDCCSKGGCFKNRVGEKGNQHCKYPTKSTNIRQAMCMGMIKPDHVVQAVNEFLDGGTGREMLVEKPHKDIEPIRVNTPKDSNLPVTICVLLYGDYYDLHKRTLSQLINNTDANKYELRIGCNEVCQQTFDWIEQHVMSKIRAKLYIEKENICKYPIMRKMFVDLNTKWVIWFDDDVRIVDTSWLEKLLADMKKNTHIGCFGKQFFYHFRGHMEAFYKNATWYRNKPFLVDPKRQMKKSDFMAGAFWAMKTAIIKKLDWPDRRLVSCGGDVALGVALHQNDVQLMQSYEGILVNDGAKRRGVSEPVAGVTRK